MAKKRKIRLDLALVERGLLESRREAQTAIMDGSVLVNGQKSTKTGTTVTDEDKVELRQGFQRSRYVSRGGFKLEKALTEFAIDPTGRICLDIGASTGGFTDCLLQHGAAKVYAVDVGYGQLDWKLRSDNRVEVKERQNARYLTEDELYGEEEFRATLCVADCSFISLTKILPPVIKLLQADSWQFVCLVKPQFEAGKNQVQVSKGVIKDRKIHVEVLERLNEFCSEEGLSISAVTFSPVKGPAGNIEYLILVTAPESGRTEIPPPFSQIVDLAFESLS